MKKKTIVFIAAILFTSINLYSLEREHEVPVNVDLGDVIVSSSRIISWEREANNYIGDVDVLSGNEVQEKTGNNIAEVLSELAGISVTDTSGGGAGSGLGSVINVRGGGEKSNTVVLLNGVKLNQIVDNSVLWKVVPVSQIDRIEVFKGGAVGTSYGEGAFSGLVNIITKKPSEESEVKIGSSFGSFGQVNNYISASGKKGNVGCNLSFNREFSSGYRENSKYDGKTGSMHLVWDVDEASSVDVYVLTHKDNTQVPGALTQQQVAEDRTQEGNVSGEFWNEYHHVQIGYEKEISEDLTCNVIAYKSWRKNDSDLGWGYYEISEPSIGMNVNLKHEKKMGDNAVNTILLGGEFSNKVASTGMENTRHSHSDVDVQGFYIQDTFSYKDKLILEIGSRFDNAVYHESLTWPSYEGSLDFEGNSPRLGITYNVNNKLSVFTSYAETFKFPSVYDIDAVTPTYNDNANLKPQTAKNYEAGVDYAFNRNFKAGLTYFEIKSPNEILYDPFAFQNDNFGTKKKGIEYYVEKKFFDKLTLKFNGTFTDAKFNDGQFSGNNLPLVPREKYNIAMQYKATKRLSFGLNWMFVNGQYRGNDFNNSLGKEHYDVLNARVNYKVNDFTVFLMLNNLLNEEYSSYSSSTGLLVGSGEYPMPKFNMLAGVEYVF